MFQLSSELGVEAELEWKKLDERKIHRYLRVMKITDRKIKTKRSREEATVRY
jgi:hypothetical protein